MTETMLELANILIINFVGFAIVLFPMWKSRDVKSWTVFVIYCGATLYMCAGLLIVKQFWIVDFRVLQLYKTFVCSPVMFISFFVFRKRVWQNVFLLSVLCMISPIYNGTGMYAGRNWFQSAAHPLLIANIVMLSLIVITLPPLLLLLRQLCDNMNVEQTKVWRVIWLLPMSFFVLFLLTSNPFDAGSFKGSAFLIIRVLIYFAMLLTCYLLKTSLQHVSENARLQEHARMTDNLLAMQREQYGRIAQNIEQTKTARHDMRHQLAAVARMSGEEKVKEYIGELLGAIPGAQDKTYCVNNAVNAVVSHYITNTERQGIRADVKLDVPEKVGSVPDMDLCVIMGNLLENALEACLRMERGTRFIRACAVVGGGFLTIVVENSFDGIWREEDGVYMSRKAPPETRGVGLTSIRAICEKHGGLMQVNINSDRWESCALVSMEE